MASLATNATLLGLISACSSKRLCKNGVSTGPNSASSLSCSHSGIADAKGYIILFGGHMGYGRSSELYMVNNKIVAKNSKTFDFNYTPFPDFGPRVEFVVDNNY